MLLRCESLIVICRDGPLRVDGIVRRKAFCGLNLVEIPGRLTGELGGVPFRRYRLKNSDAINLANLLR